MRERDIDPRDCAINGATVGVWMESHDLIRRHDRHIRQFSDVPSGISIDSNIRARPLLTRPHWRLCIYIASPRPAVPLFLLLLSLLLFPGKDPTVPLPLFSFLFQFKEQRESERGRGSSPKTAINEKDDWCYLDFNALCQLLYKFSLILNFNKRHWF